MNLAYVSKIYGQILQHFLMELKKSDKIIGNIARMIEFLVHL